MEINEIFEKINQGNFKNKLLKVFSGKSNFFILVFVLILLAYCGYLWYFNVYNFSWSESQKQDYAREKSSGEVSFNEKKFNDVVSKIEKRKLEYQREIEITKDIFDFK